MRRTALDRAATERLIDAGRRFALRMSGVVSSLKTYPADHPSLQFSYRGVSEALSEMVDLIGATVVTIDGEGVVVGDQRASIDKGSHEHMADLIGWLAARDTTTIRCDAEVTQEQVQQLVGLMLEVEAEERAERRDEINKQLAAAGLGHIRLEARGGAAAPRERSEDPALVLLESYLEVATLTEDLVLNGPRSGTLAAIEDAMQVLVDVLQPRPGLVRLLLGLGKGIEFETRHIANMTVLSVAVGARFGMSREALADLGRAVATMDVGMRVLPPDVRRASRELRPAEIATLHTHPIESVRAHLNARQLDATVRRRLLVAMEQHLGIHRDGYPAVHRWPSLHLFSRIASACDAFDALTSDTAWRRALTAEQALAQLSPPTDKSHDPVVVAEICAVLGLFPPGCHVRLSDNRTAAIIRGKGPGGLPVVRVDGSGDELELAARGADGALQVTITEIMIGNGAR